MGSVTTSGIPVNSPLLATFFTNQPFMTYSCWSGTRRRLNAGRCRATQTLVRGTGGKRLLAGAARPGGLLPLGGRRYLHPAFPRQHLRLGSESRGHCRLFRRRRVAV